MHLIGVSTHIPSLFLGRKNQFFAVGIASFCIFTPLSAQGQTLQVIPDGSTGTTVLNSPDCTASCTIQGITAAGGNLFHSFSKFSIPAGVIVTFEDGGATNILSRVTGAQSQIQGTLAVTGPGNANFFLINPAGIIFGPQASLNLAGSFIASTADSLNFLDGSQFSAMSTAPPILTISTPIGLQFGSIANPIVNQSQASPGGAINSAGLPVGLQVKPNQTLALVGGDVSLAGGNLTALGGRIELGSVAANSRVELIPAIHGFTLGYENSPAFQDIQLTQAAIVDTSGASGTVQLQGRAIALVQGSQVTNYTLGDSSAGPLSLAASDSVELLGTAPSGFPSGLFFPAFPGSTADSGNLSITTNQLLVQDGALISGGTGAAGNGGLLAINASESIELIGTGLFTPSLITTSTQGEGKAGDIILNTNRLSLLDGAQIQSVTFGPGQGGTVFVNAATSVALSGAGSTLIEPETASSLLATSGADFLPFPVTGNSGDISINTNVLTIQNDARVAVSSLGAGNSGTLIVNAQTVSLDTQGQLTAASVSGDGGNIQLQDLDTLNLDENSLITATAGSGDGGSLEINARSVNLNGQSQITAEATDGTGGNLQFSGVESLNLTDNSQISATAGTGTGGSLTIEASAISLDNQSELTADTTTGSGGIVSLLNVDSLALNQGSFISASAGAGTDQSDGGSLTINARSIDLNQSQLNANAASGSGGNIQLQGLEALNLKDGSQISATTGAGTGGSLAIESSAISLNGQSELTADATSGSGGIISLLADTLTLTQGSLVSASAGAGSDQSTGGSLTINARSVGLNQSQLNANAASGSGGNIQLQGLEFLSLNNDSQISATTGAGSAESTGGSLTISAQAIDLNNQSRLTADAASGNGGNIQLQTNTLTLNQNSQISAIAGSGTGQGSGGTVDIAARTVRLDNQSQLTAAATADNGGNLRLHGLDNLILRRNSLVSATAEGGTGNGGNIEIAADFIVAVPGEDSDIVARASQGQGGNIQITAAGLLGIELRPAIPGNGTNDIDASSDLGVDGLVTITQPITDPTQALLQLSEAPLNVSNQVAQGCGEAAAGNQFVVTGRGGLPPNPTAALEDSTPLADLGAPNSPVVTASTVSQAIPTTPAVPPRRRIVEAQGWTRNSQGEVVLLAQTEKTMASSPWLPNASCQQ